MAIALSRVKKLSKEEMNLLINSFIALRHIHRMIEEVEGDISKLADTEAEKEIKHIWRRLRSGLFGSEERTERKLARSYADLTGEIKEANLSSEDQAKFNQILLQGNIFNSLLEKLGSRGGEIEQALKEAMEDPKNSLKLKAAEKKVEEAIKGVKGFEVDMKNILELLKEEPKTYKKFTASISQNEAKSQYKILSSISKKRKLIYKEDISENATYFIFRNRMEIMFVIVENGKDVAFFIFKEEGDLLNLVHRIVMSKHLGISGTLFFRKAENYLKFLRKNGYLKPKQIYMDASQVAVIKWALKIGFEFEDGKLKESFEFIFGGKSRNYVTDIAIIDPSMDEFKSPSDTHYRKVGYVFRKDFYDQHRDLFEADGKSIYLKKLQSLMPNQNPRDDNFATIKGYEKFMFRPRLVKDI